MTPDNNILNTFYLVKDVTDVYGCERMYTDVYGYIRMYTDIRHYQFNAIKCISNDLNLDKSLLASINKCSTVT